jgi:quercetin dioxygenase-like cupin family protein
VTAVNLLAIPSASLWLVPLLLLSSACAPAAFPRSAKLVVFPAEPSEVAIVSGPPETAGMHAGYVALKPGAEMHRHTTGEHEEMLVFLRGRGEVLVGAEHISVAAGAALYIPPRTEHEVHATAPDELDYVYTVAPVR